MPPVLVTHSVASFTTSNQEWILDSGPSHHITSTLANLSLYSQYDGLDELLIGDGSSLRITHVDETQISTPNSSFPLSNVLYVPPVSHNLVSVSKFCETNNVLIEFHSTYFLMKDRCMGATLMHGPNKAGVYQVPILTRALRPQPQAFLGEQVTVSYWHL